MLYVLVPLHLIVCLLLIGVVLIQRGEGGSLMSAFASQSQTVFGSQAINVFVKATWILGGLFFFLSIWLALAFGHGMEAGSSVLSDTDKPVASAPASSAASAAASSAASSASAPASAASAPASAASTPASAASVANSAAVASAPKASVAKASAPAKSAPASAASTPASAAKPASSASAASAASAP